MPVDMHFITADAMVVAENHVLLIKRGREPYKGCWAFPGGHLDKADESVRHAAARELREETGIDLFPSYLNQIEIIDKGRSDPRGHYICFVYKVNLYKRIDVKALDDADDVRWVPLHEVKKLDMAFDHLEIIERNL